MEAHKDKISKIVEFATKALKERAIQEESPLMNHFLKSISAMNRFTLFITYSSIPLIPKELIDPISHKEFIDVLFDPPLDKLFPVVPPTNEAFDVQNAYRNLLLFLLHANIDAYWSRLIQFCVENLICPMHYCLLKSIKTQTNHNTSFKYNFIHDILKYIVERVPQYSKLLTDKLERIYPHVLTPSSFHRVYVSNLLKIHEYALDIRPSILRLMVLKLIELDAYVSKQSGLTTSSSQQDGEKTEQQEMVDKLDELMFRVFEFIKEHNTSSSMIVLDSIFTSLLQVFETHIVQNNQLHFVQFLMFYICSLSHTYSKRFLMYLTNIAFNSRVTDMNYRVSCTLYVASFLSRANFLTEEHVVVVIENLLNFLILYSKTFPTHSNAIQDIHSHKIFYAITQCIFYVLCYKIEKLMSHPRIREYTRERVLKMMDEVVKSSYNPFKVIPIDIVEEVTKLLKHYKLCDFGDVIKRNTTIYLAERNPFGQKNQLGTSSSGLAVDEFFPFDPYLLSRSKEFLNPIYQSYKQIYEDEDEEEEGVQSSDEEEESSDEEPPSVSIRIQKSRQRAEEEEDDYSEELHRGISQASEEEDSYPQSFMSDISSISKSMEKSYATSANHRTDFFYNFFKKNNTVSIDQSNSQGSDIEKEEEDENSLQLHNKYEEEEDVEY